MKHLTADPDLSGVPLRYRRVIERALFKDPAKRFGSVGEMLRALQLGDDKTGNKSIPPIVIPTAEVEPDGPIYIGEEGVTSDDIVFGPVVEVVSASPDRIPVITTTADAGEPIAVAVRRVIATRWIGGATRNSTRPLKVTLLVIGIIMLIAASEVLLPVAIVLGALYLVYRAVRLVVMSGRVRRSDGLRRNAQQMVSTPHARDGQRDASKSAWQVEAVKHAKSQERQAKG